jgi:hypothetical protein
MIKATRRTATIVLAVVSGLVLVAVILATYLRTPRPSRLELMAFMGSVQRVADARRERGEPPLASVSVRELLERGHISEAQARLFKGAEVRFRKQRQGETVPLERAATEVLFSVKLRDGRNVEMTSDGSVHLHQSRVALGL